MPTNLSRRTAFMLLAVVFIFLLVRGAAWAESDSEEGTIPPLPPLLENPDMECDIGYYEVPGPNRKPNGIPNGWQQVLSEGHPRMNSTRIQFGKRCDAEDVHVEKISGRDSFLAEAWDLETPPDPGKVFDVTIYQQAAADPGGDYSVSGWFLTLCGGSAVPNDCPEGVYMAKMLGLDPSGGTDPHADTVIWVENRNNFVDDDDNRIGWANLYTAATAESTQMTVFARINSPFQWHGNHGFIDAISLVRSPNAELVGLPAEVEGDLLELIWIGEQSPDVEAIQGGNYDLLFDIEARHESQETWRRLVDGMDRLHTIPFQARCYDSSYEFRIRARAEQPDDEEGAWPNQRYPGPWSDPHSVYFRSRVVQPPLEPDGNLIFLPQIVGSGEC